MQIHQYPDIPQTPADADVLAIEANGVTYKVSKAALAAAIATNITPGNIGAYSKAETDSLVAARMYPVYGNIIKSASTGTAVGYGKALVYIVGQTVIVEFEGKIITEGTITNVYDVGIQVANLRSINSAIPAFTVAERGIVHYYKSDGTLDTSMEGYAGTSALNVSGGHWACGRVYDTNGSIGAWSDNKYAVGTIITGRLYGTR